jgi:hypothetical protein
MDDIVNPIGVRRVNGAIGVNRSATIVMYSLPSRDDRNNCGTMHGCTNEP